MYYIQIDKSSSKSNVSQIMKSIELAIENQILKDQDQLPTVADIATYYEISDISVRIAFQRLQNKGLIRSIKGKGTFVSLRPHYIVPLKTYYDQAHYIKSIHDTFNRNWLYTNKKGEKPLKIKLHATINNYPIYHQQIEFYQHDLLEISQYLTNSIQMKDFFIQLNKDKSITIDNIFSPKNADHLDAHLLQIREKDPIHKIVTQVTNHENTLIARIETFMPASFITFEVLL